MSNKLQKNQSEPQEQIDRFLDLQHKEVELRKNELEFRKNSENNSYQVAIKNLDAVKEDRQSERVFQDKQSTKRYIFSGVMIFIFMALLAYAMYLGKEKMAYEILKTIAFLIAGGIGGYSWKLTKENKKDD